MNLVRTTPHPRVWLRVCTRTLPDKLLLLSLLCRSCCPGGRRSSHERRQVRGARLHHVAERKDDGSIFFGLFSPAAACVLSLRFGTAQDVLEPKGSITGAPFGN